MSLPPRLSGALGSRSLDRFLVALTSLCFLRSRAIFGRFLPALRLLVLSSLVIVLKAIPQFLVRLEQLGGFFAEILRFDGFSLVLMLFQRKIGPTKVSVLVIVDEFRMEVVLHFVVGRHNRLLRVF